MTAYDPTSGELRTHYAGFFDPRVRLRPRQRGPRVRGANSKWAPCTTCRSSSRNGQRVCKLTFEHMLAEPSVFYGDSGARLSAPYEEDALGKHFLRPTPPVKAKPTRRLGGDELFPDDATYSSPFLAR